LDSGFLADRELFNLVQECFSPFDDFEKTNDTEAPFPRSSVQVWKIRLCPAVLKRQQRIKLEMSNVRLQEIADSSAR